tara:strand:- start:922 stop:1626 length:705 start_codon:yes stop_codon:yes gene_type:complete
MNLSLRSFIFAALLAAGTYFVFFYSASKLEQTNEEQESITTSQDTMTYSQKEEDAAWEALIHPKIKPTQHPKAVVEVLSADTDNPDRFKIKVHNMELLTNPVLKENVIFHTAPNTSFAAEVDYIEISPYGSKIWTAIHKRNGVPSFSQITVGEYIILGSIHNGKNSYFYSIDKSTGEGTVHKEDPSKITVSPEPIISQFSEDDTARKSTSTKTNQTVRKASHNLEHIHITPKKG